VGRSERLLVASGDVRLQLGQGRAIEFANVIVDRAVSFEPLPGSDRGRPAADDDVAARVVPITAEHRCQLAVRDNAGHIEGKVVGGRLVLCIHPRKARPGCSGAGQLSLNNRDFGSTRGQAICDSGPEDPGPDDDDPSHTGRVKLRRPASPVSPDPRPAGRLGRSSPEGPPR
jgi:hypothetical protein